MAQEINIERTSTPVGLSQAAQSAHLRLFFGGSFDPPHIGHATLPNTIIECIDGKEQEHSRMIIVPAARSPFKTDDPVEDLHRIRMLELALRDKTDWEIWDQELRDASRNPGQPSYWADTWSIVRQMDLPGTDRFLIGSDQALTMHRWRRFHEFWHDAIVMLRDDTDSVESLIAQLSTQGIWSDQDLDHWRSSVIAVPSIDASSTDIRAALTNPALREQPIEGLDPSVHRYILDHDLYRS